MSSSNGDILFKKSMWPTGMFTLHKKNILHVHEYEHHSVSTVYNVVLENTFIITWTIIYCKFYY